MNAVRSISEIQHDLETALEYRRRSAVRPSDDPGVALMRSANEADIVKLEAELRMARSSTLEVTLEGLPVDDHRIAVPYFSRVLDSLQSSYRTILRSLTPEKSVPRSQGTLSVAGTGPGSFRVSLTLPPTQLDLLGDAPAQRALDTVVDLLGSTTADKTVDAARRWAEHQDETAVRAVIRLAAALASSRGTTRMRLSRLDGTEHFISVTAEAARDLASALAGQSGREIITLTGHLQMAQDRPPRVRIDTEDDHYLASVPDELLDLVKSLLFDTVQATLVIDMRTSLTTGSPDVDVQLMDLEPVLPEQGAG